MGKILSLIGVGVCSVALLTGCAGVMNPVVGAFYSDVRAPLTATSNTGSSKVGEGIAKSYVGIFATGDASIETAAKSAGITKIHHVDYHAYNIWVFYAKYTVTVYGE
jgi:hypothetical protein